VLKHPSSAGPQAKPSEAQVAGTQVCSQSLK
jgi:hypothetical protein